MRTGRASPTVASGPISLTPGSGNEIASGRRRAWRWLSCFLVFAALAPVTIDPPYRNGPAIRSDGLGYHAWTRALIERDVAFCSPELDAVGAISERDPDRDVCQNRYPFGLALLRLPVMAPLVDARPGAPFVSEAEHTASLYLSALALLVTCILAGATCRLLGIPPGSTHAALLAFVFGTGLFHYGTYDGSFTHVYSALGIAVMVWIGVRAARYGAGWLTLAARE